MEKISAFKEFAKKNPILVKYVRNNEMTWQKFYEIYDLYGEDENAWNDYLVKTNSSSQNVSTNLSFSDLLGAFKNMNLDNLQEGISSVQRVVGMLNELIVKKDDNNTTEYKPRPLYKHFDD